MTFSVHPQLNILALFLLPALCVSGLIGNILVCIAIAINKHLHNVTNYFLFSLAIADLLVCVIVMPFSIIVEVSDGSWNWNFLVCLVYVYADVFLCSASIVHMTTISLDRYIGISKPLSTRNRRKTTIILKISSVWVITAIITGPIIALALWDNSNILSESMCAINNRLYMVYGSTLIFLIPFIVMLLAYLKTTSLLSKQKLSGLFESKGKNNTGLRRTIHRKKEKQKLSESNIELQKGNGFKDSKELKPLISNDDAALNLDKTSNDLRTTIIMRTLSRHLIKRYSSLPRSNSVDSEQKATRVLSIVFSCFFICWTPFFANNFLAGFCGKRCEPPQWVGTLFLWLGYCSSIINPIIYTIFNKKFRETFIRILRCQCKQTRLNDLRQSIRSSSKNHLYDNNK
uniref:G_PROTEIN_RECEP_F1_2 domain-containing protein n=1 Tax=Parastrongyloides trichosuri TaxID=131310 RepID=A0A0N4ZZ08_PARTI